MDRINFIKKNLKKILVFFLCVLAPLKRALSRFIENPEVARWYSDRGDKTKRIFYELTEDSLVFDLGGYMGDWSSDIFSICSPKIFIFEPVPEFVDIIRKRFEKNKRISVYPFGLGDKTENVKLSINGPGSSMFMSGGKGITVEIRDVVKFMDNNNIALVDLMKINIEGEEYNLLNRLIDSGYVNRIKNIQVQFHDFMPDSERRMVAIQNKLKRTHVLTYQYRFVWENWKLR
jgi:FkbM family methyltransferase